MPSPHPLLLCVLALLVAVVSTRAAASPDAASPQARRTTDGVAMGSNMTLECSVCEYVVVWVELHIVARKPDITKQEVLSVLHEVCNSTVLGKYKTACLDFLSAEGDKIVQEIFNGTQGQLICATMVPQLCPAPTVSAHARAFAQRSLGARKNSLGKTSPA